MSILRSFLYNFFSLVIFILLSSALLSETLHFNIDFKGVRVAHVEMTQDKNTLTVKAKSTLLADIFSYRFDNKYEIVYGPRFLPISYRKTIRQHNFSEDTLTRYTRSPLVANRAGIVNANQQINISYPIFPETREFFSTLYFLRTQDLRTSHSFIVDNAGKLSSVSVKYLEAEQLKTNIGNVMTHKIQITFAHLDDKERPKSDILSNNLIEPGNILTFWITTDERRLPVRAQYTMRRLSISWSIRKVE